MHKENEKDRLCEEGNEAVVNENEKREVKVEGKEVESNTGGSQERRGKAVKKVRRKNLHSGYLTRSLMGRRKKERKRESSTRGGGR